MHDLVEDLTGRTVVSLDGDDLAVVDGVHDRDGTPVALALARTGLFGGRMDEVVPLDALVGVGPDAAIVTGGDVLVVPDDELDLVAPTSTPRQDAEARLDDLEVTGLRCSEARHRDVVDDEGEVLGRVDRFVVDPATARVGSLRLDNVPDMRRYLSWREIRTFGDTVVTEERALRLPDGQREERVRRDFGMLHKPVLTDAGHRLGEVVDVAFDPADGSLTAIDLDTGVVAGDRLRGVGPHAVVVAH